MHTATLDRSGIVVDTMTNPHTRQWNGREVYRRSDLVDAGIASRATLERLWRERADNQHPEPCGKDGQHMVWDAAEWDTWNQRRLHPDPDVQEYQRVVGVSYAVPGVDYSGNPDELLTASEVARVLGRPVNTITVYVRRPPAGWPEPDETETTPGGLVRRKYRRHRIWEWADYNHHNPHPGGGRPTGATSGRRYPYDGDPRLDIARTALQNTPPAQHPDLPVQLASQHGHAPGTWTGILAVARQHPTAD